MNFLGVITRTVWKNIGENIALMKNVIIISMMIHYHGGMGLKISALVIGGVRGWPCHALTKGP